MKGFTNFKSNFKSIAAVTIINSILLTTATASNIHHHHYHHHHEEHLRVLDANSFENSQVSPINAEKDLQV